MAWRTITHNDQILHDLGVNDDGTLHNPNNYPEDLVRAAVAGAEEQRHVRRCQAAKQAAVTRARRKEKRVYAAAKRIVEGHRYGPAANCYICGKGLSDEDSIERGIGSDCWQFVMALLTDGTVVRVSA